MKKVLVACEESQAVTSELRKLGFDAYSCDIIDSSGGHPEWHIIQDVLALINGNCTFKTTDGETHTVNGKWDMIIAFPPCTHLAVSGARHFEKKRADGRQREVYNENGKTISYNDPRTAKARSKTFPGIAKAMADQWTRDWRQ